MAQNTDDGQAIISALAETISRRAEACAGASAEEAARAWFEQGFDDPEEVEAWLDVGCPEAAHARRLEDAGITPEQAALRTDAGASGAEDTLGRKLARGELSFEEARRIITREFWND
jgi:hypothetical protein